jgi:hypothetical protein
METINNSTQSSAKWINISKKTKWVVPINKLYVGDKPKSITFTDNGKTYIVRFNLMIEKSGKDYKLSFIGEPEILQKVDGDE